MPAGTRSSPNDAHTAARYTITIDGVVVADFSELVEISSELDPSESAREREEESESIRERRGKLLATVTLSRGQTNSLSLFQWHRNASGRAGARDAILAMYNTAGQAIAKFDLTRARPTKLEITTRGVGASDILYETVTLTCEDIQRVSP
jgi:phage tail-like protein